MDLMNKMLSVSEDTLDEFAKGQVKEKCATADMDKLDGKDKKGKKGKKDKKEGKIPSDSDSEATKIKKLTEEDEELDLDTPPEEEDEAPPEEEEEAPPESPEEGKEYFGSKDDIYYYMEKDVTDGDQVSDIRIVDQEGNEVFSAIKAELDPNDVLKTLIQAIQDVDIAEISYDIFTSYILPALIEEEEEEEEEEMLSDEESSEEDELPPEDEELPEESIKTSVVVGDDTIEVVGNENVIRVGKEDFKFSTEFLERYKVDGKLTEEKIKELALDILAQKKRKDKK